MRTSDADILIVPGWSNSGPDHWQSRWERNLRTARRVEQADWMRPDREAWVGRLVEEVGLSTRPVVLVAHSLGVTTVLHAAPMLDLARSDTPTARRPERAIGGAGVVGAFLVSPSDLDAIGDWPREEGQDWQTLVASFQPMPADRLPFPARVIASSADSFCSVERAQALGAAWGADVSIVADAGHINGQSGHGPWPEGLLTFGMFLKSLT